MLDRREQDTGHRDGDQAGSLRSGRAVTFILLLVSLVYQPLLLRAQTEDETVLAQNLKRLSIEDLLNLEVTSVSRRAEKLSEVASAIQVITQEDIRRSGATSLPEALRLATNLQVAQFNSYASIISARGFNYIFANKLLVMIDGRTVYSPQFAGVYWDLQSVLLEDIERIEVISGPGGTIWGANAVNGVINVITKSAADTKGLYASAAAGTYLKRFGALRYGGKIGSKLSYRVFAQQNDRNNTFLPDGNKHADEWGLTHGGLRLDWALSKQNHLMLQGNLYDGKEETMPNSSTFDAQNVMGRWTRQFSATSELVVQAYFDRTWRQDKPSTFDDELKTYDLEIDHRFAIGKRHSLLWGIGYRLMQNHSINNTDFVALLPARRNMDLYSVFLQDEITLVPEKFRFILGTKLQHNEFTGLEIQPSARMAYTPNASHTLWGAISRAVRTPSRIDRDYHIPGYPVAPPDPSVAGGPNFDSEKVIAYELGYRAQPGSKVSLSLAAFYNLYKDLYSVDPLPGTQTYQIQNNTEGSSWGAEFAGTYQLLQNWRIRGGYTYFNKELQNKPGSAFNYAILGNDAAHRALLQSFVELPGNLQLDVTGRYVSSLPNPAVPEYFTYDARLAWLYKEWLEISLIGQNLGKDRHVEFANEIPRSVYGKVTCRF